MSSMLGSAPTFEIIEVTRGDITLPVVKYARHIVGVGMMHVFTGAIAVAGMGYVVVPDC